MLVYKGTATSESYSLALHDALPIFHPMMGIESGDAVNHQVEFADHTVTADGMKAIRDGALSMAYTIIDMADQDVWDRLRG